MFDSYLYKLDEVLQRVREPFGGLTLPSSEPQDRTIEFARKYANQDKEMTRRCKQEQEFATQRILKRWDIVLDRVKKETVKKTSKNTDE